MRLIKILIIAGFVIGAAGIAIALPAEDRSLGFGVFMAGFFLAAGGMVANMFAVPSASTTRPVLPGLKIAAIGFAIVLIGSLLSLILEQESLPKVFFYSGFAVFVVGILFGIFGVARSNR